MIRVVVLNVGQKLKVSLMENDNVKIISKPDFDWDVIDIMLVVGDEEYYIKGFDDFEWEEANEFGESLAKALCVTFYPE